MKIYLVVEYVDLGYFVEKVFADKPKAEEYAEQIKKDRLSKNPHYLVHNIDVEEAEVVE